MHLDRRVTLVGIMVIVLSVTMATQFATTKVGYSYNIVHPSNADIRFIGSDNSSDGIMVLRVDGDNSSGGRNVKVELGGNWTENYNKTYKAAFGIVNEERFNVTITHINVSTSAGSDYMQIWVHGDRDQEAGSDETSVMVWNKGSTGFGSNGSAWVLGEGNQNAANMNTGGAAINTPWSETAHVRYSYSNVNAVNGTDDYVWVQLSLDIPDGAASGSYSGLIWVHFKSNG